MSGFQQLDFHIGLVTLNILYYQFNALKTDSIDLNVVKSCVSELTISIESINGESFQSFSGNLCSILPQLTPPPNK